MNKETLLNLIAENLVTGSNYSPKIEEKYKAIIQELNNLRENVINKGHSLLDVFIEKYPHLEKEKLLSYMETDKMPHKIREELEELRKEIYSIEDDFIIQLPMFTWYECRRMKLRTVLILKEKGLIDKRIFPYNIKYKKI